MYEDIIRKFIIKELSKFKFNKYTNGFKYLEDTIYFCIIEEDSIDNLSKNVFTKIAKKYNKKSYLNVKWCIDRVINTMYNNTDMNFICNYFNIKYNVKPSLKFIVYTIVSNYRIRKI